MPVVPTQHNQDKKAKKAAEKATVTDGDGNTTPANVNDQGQAPVDAPQNLPHNQKQGEGTHETPVQTAVSANPSTEADLTREESATETRPVGGADHTADPTADGAVSQAENTHPQSPTHKGDLSTADKKAIVEESGKPGAQIQSIAERFGVTSERVLEVVNDHNNVPEDER